MRDEDGAAGAGVAGPRRWTSPPRGLAAAARRGPACWSAAGSPLEDAYAYAKFARVALDTNDVDFRARPHSAEEADFLAAQRRRAADSASPTPTWRRRPTVLLVGFEPEEESPIVFLRLRKAVRRRNAAGLLRRAVRHPRAGQARGTLLPTAPGTEPEVLDALRDR